jgi:hypothetical protein
MLLKKIRTIVPCSLREVTGTTVAETQVCLGLTEIGLTGKELH